MTTHAENPLEETSTVAMPSRSPANYKRKRTTRRIFELAGTVLIFVIFVLLWQAAITVFKISNFLLPSPLAVWQAVVADGSNEIFWVQNVLTTVTEIAIGFAIAIVLGTLVGLLLGTVPLLDRLFSPYVIMFQALPKITLAPIIIVWLGFGLSSKIVITVLVAFFPVFVNVLNGFKAIDKDQELLFRSLQANRRQMIMKLRLWAILPYFFAGLEIGIILALLGAILGEFLGASRGLGALIVLREGNLQIAGIFSVLVYLAAIGNIMHILVVLARRRFASWANQRDNVGL